MPRRACAVLLSIALWLSVASTALADDDQPTDPNAQPEPPSGPVLALPGSAPAACDPSSPRQRFLEVRGSGFDNWALQRLNGRLVDADGTPQINWSSVWVSPQGKLTLEVNLCADPFRGRSALVPGTYSLSVGSDTDGVIASTDLDVATPPDDTAPSDMPAAAPAPAPVTPSVPPTTDVSPAPVPPVTTSSRAVPPATNPQPAPRTGPGTRQQPLPFGAPGQLPDGWQIVIAGVTPDAWSGIHAAVPSSARVPASDQRDVMLRIEATYRGDGTGIFTAGRISLLSTASGKKYDQNNDNCGIVPEPLGSAVLTNGGVQRGNVCFTVRASDVDSLVLFDAQPPADQQVYFLLH